MVEHKDFKKLEYGALYQDLLPLLTNLAVAENPLPNCFRPSLLKLRTKPPILER